MKINARVILKSGKDQSLMRLHPWIFSGAIKKIQGDPGEGDLVDLYNNRDEFLAFGHYQKSSIAVRVLSFDEKEKNDDIWEQRIQKAWDLRQEIGLTGSEHTNVFRWINGKRQDCRYYEKGGRRKVKLHL